MLGKDYSFIKTKALFYELQSLYSVDFNFVWILVELECELLNHGFFMLIWRKDIGKTVKCSYIMGFKNDLVGFLLLCDEGWWKIRGWGWLSYQATKDFAESNYRWFKFCLWVVAGDGYTLIPLLYFNSIALIIWWEAKLLKYESAALLIAKVRTSDAVLSAPLLLQYWVLIV